MPTDTSQYLGSDVWSYFHTNQIWKSPPENRDPYNYILNLRNVSGGITHKTNSIDEWILWP